ncbi:MAG: addiction module toxin RelE [Deltaproteobacteria bacterium RIFOXYD12_FULL_55_16]|nr:MAG: addiction module toxin RelE [Deltaproteobacteria bacterium RIFOXYD12_FULL_55_16]
MKLEWSRLAIEDRDKIFDFIEQDDPRAAVSVDERIKEQTEMLIRFPECGRTGRVEGTRELVISRTPYIVAYRVLDETIRILRLLHGAQLWPDDIH